MPERIRAAARTHETPVCPLCRAEIQPEDGSISTCRGCAVDYHSTCWRELGGCATLGCGMRSGPGAHGKVAGACPLCQRVPEPQRPVETCQACSATYHALCWRELGPRCRSCQAQIGEEITTGVFYERRRLPLDALTCALIAGPLLGLLIPSHSSPDTIVALITLLVVGVLLAGYVLWRGIQPRVVVTDETLEHHVFPGVVQEVSLSEITQAWIDEDSLWLFARRGVSVHIALRRWYRLRHGQVETAVFSDEVQGRLMSLLEARGVHMEQGRPGGSPRR